MNKNVRQLRLICSLTVLLIYAFSMIVITQRVWIYHEYETVVIIEKKMEPHYPLLTLFTSWKSNMENSVVYNNTMHLWPNLQPEVQVVLFSNENETTSTAQDFGWNILPITETRCNGTPVLKKMFSDVKTKFKSVFYGYANGDILFDTSLVDTLKAIQIWMKNIKKPLLVSGKRISINLDKTNLLKFSAQKIVEHSAIKGTVDHGYAEDYFIVTRNFQWKFFPDLVIGRPKVDNHLLFMSRKKGVVVVDGSASVLAVHQMTGSRRKNSNDCNRYILSKAKQYDMRRIRKGNIECAPFESRYNRNGTIDIFRRGQFTTVC